MRRLGSAVFVLSTCFARAASPSPDPIEGKWYGEAGFPQDRIAVGFEFKRNGKGELKAFLYEPVGNFYGLELPGGVDRKGETYTIGSYDTTLTLHGDALEGTYLPTKVPAALHRTGLLPSEP